MSIWAVNGVWAERVEARGPTEVFLLLNGDQFDLVFMLMRGRVCRVGWVLGEQGGAQRRYWLDAFSQANSRRADL